MGSSFIHLIRSDSNEFFLMAATPVFLPGEFHGQRSLVGHSACGYQESDVNKQLTVTQINK